jgi:hypothetical protein
VKGRIKYKRFLCRVNRKFQFREDFTESRALLPEQISLRTQKKVKPPGLPASGKCQREESPGKAVLALGDFSSLGSFVRRNDNLFIYSSLFISRVCAGHKIRRAEQAGMIGCLRGGAKALAFWEKP